MLRAFLTKVEHCKRINAVICVRGVSNVSEESKNLYVLPMFPYPSGKIHMGHVRVFSISDCITRYKAMCGYNVIHPMGWDAFGLPAENAAIERNIPPEEWTVKNIAEMRKQIAGLNYRFDWDREVNTSSPDYYKWTQWLFLKLWEKGFVTRRNGLVNWDPVDHTVLANEQVDEEGRSWRSGALVEKRSLTQWYVLTTKMSESLLKGLDDLPNWPSIVKTAQRKWIGKSTGAEFSFLLTTSAAGTDKIKVFTTHPETLYGVSFIGLSATHPITLHFAASDPSLRQFLNRVGKSSFKVGQTQVDGYKLPIQATHPLTHKPLAVYVTNYVLSDYGEGAIMGVPTHDARDASFASLFHLPAVQVLTDSPSPLLCNSGDLDGLSVSEATRRLLLRAQREGWGNGTTKYRLRDWLVSRQRYWGAPVPAIHCPHCGIVPVPESDLPVRLPAMYGMDVAKMRGADAVSPLERYTEWRDISCPYCGSAHARRDCDTLDTFMDSSWYFYRYLDSKNPSVFCDSSKMEQFPVVNYYVGGSEHSIMHLLFARFIARFLYEQGFAPCPEPFDHLITQGMVLGSTFIDGTTGAYVHPENVEREGKGWRTKDTHHSVEMKYMKMSKSKYNGVDPVEVVNQYGSDAVRVGMLMQCPPANAFMYNSKIMNPAADMIRKLERVCQICLEGANPSGKKLDTNKLNLQHNKILHDMDHFDFHNVLSGVNIMMNDLLQGCYSKSYLDYVKRVILFMAPFAPLKSESCWNSLIQGKCISRNEVFARQRWPEVLESTSTTVIIQVNGKMRKTFNLGSFKHESMDDRTLLSTLEKNEEVRNMLSFVSRDIKVIRKGNKVVINYLK